MTQSNSEQLEQALKKAVDAAEFSIPAYPAVAIKLQKAVSDPNSSVGKVSEIVSADPVLAASVLSSANSALRASDAEITTVPRAVNRLGIQAVATIALANGIGQGALQKGALFDARYRAWRRSVTSAVLGQALAPSGSLDPDHAFLMGLLSGVGRSVALAALERIVKKHKPSRPLEVSDWLKLAERHSRTLAAIAVKRWKLPSSFSSLFNQGTDANQPLLLLAARAETLAIGFDSGVPVVAENPSEEAILDRVFRELPGFLLGLAPVPDDPQSDPELIAPPPPSEHFGACPEGLVVTDLRAKARAELRCTGVRDVLLRAESSRAFQAGSVVHLSLTRDSAPQSFWFNVRSSVEWGSSYLIEFVLFSSAKEQRELWRAVTAP